MINSLQPGLKALRHKYKIVQLAAGGNVQPVCHRRHWETEKLLQVPGWTAEQSLQAGLCGDKSVVKYFTFKSPRNLRLTVFYDIFLFQKVYKV